MVTCTAAGSRSQLRCGRGSRWPSSRTLGHTGQGPQPQRAGYTLGVQEPKCRSEVPRPSLPLVLGGNRWSLRSRSGSWAPGLGVGSAGSRGDRSLTPRRTRRAAHGSEAAGEPDRTQVSRVRAHCARVTARPRSRPPAPSPGPPSAILGTGCPPTGPGLHTRVPSSGGRVTGDAPRGTVLPPLLGLAGGTGLAAALKRAAVSGSALPGPLITACRALGHGLLSLAGLGSWAQWGTAAAAYSTSGGSPAAPPAQPAGAPRNGLHLNSERPVGVWGHVLTVPRAHLGSVGGTPGRVLMAPVGAAATTALALRVASLRVEKLAGTGCPKVVCGVGGAYASSPRREGK